VTTAADAILAAVRAAVPADVTVFDSIVPGIAPSRYVMMYIPAGVRSSQSVDAASDCVTVDFQVTSVASGSDPTYAAAMCRWLAGAVRDALTDLYVTVDGLSAARVVHKGSQGPRADEATPDKKVYATDQFSWETVRTS
jgi:hypothetical protein